MCGNQESNTKTHHIFVYGTLKRGLYNTEKMFDPETGVSKFVGMAKTVEKYPFVVATTTSTNVPYLLDKPGYGKVSISAYNYV